MKAELAETTVIYIKGTDNPEQHELLKIDFVTEPVDYVKKNADAFITETFSDSDRDIDANGYLVGDEDHADHMRITNHTIVLAARPMNDDEIEEYEDARDAHGSEVARDQMAGFDRFDRSING